MRQLRFIYTSGGEVEEEAGWMRWWRSHPGTEERVRALLGMEAAWAARQWKVAV
jgi:Zn-dependent protease with chaperone function